MPLSFGPWYRRDLSQKEQLHYVEAVKCLMSTPSKSNNLYPAAKSRFDDFQGMHIKVGHAMHFNVSGSAPKEKQDDPPPSIHPALFAGWLAG